jgi:hypothetical protein
VRSSNENRDRSRILQINYQYVKCQVFKFIQRAELPDPNGTLYIHSLIKKGDPKGPPEEQSRFVYASLMESSYLFKASCSLPIKPNVKKEFKAFYQIDYSK